MSAFDPKRTFARSLELFHGFRIARSGKGVQSGLAKWRPGTNTAPKRPNFMLGRSPRRGYSYGSSLKIWQKPTCAWPSKPTGMIALRRSTTYAGKFGRVPNPKEIPTNRPAQVQRFRPNEIA